MNNHKRNILIVDDEADIRSLMRGILEDEGYDVQTVAHSEEAYQVIGKKVPDLAILDIWLQNSEQDGSDILKVLRQKYPFMPIIMISGHGTIETAVTSIKQGAYDFIEKPFKSDRLILMIRRALEASELKKENHQLKELAVQKMDVSLSGQSPSIEYVRHMIDRIAPTNSRVFITGEPGTGKETAARLIHKKSPRASKPLLIMSCATMQPDHMEEELFGSEISGQVKTGLLERAHGGTLLFDEISDMPLETQAKIVRILQEQIFTRVGGAQMVQVDVRFLASSHRDLEALVGQGLFRKDLYYRLNVVPLQMPPLQERLQDIPELVRAFIKEIAQTSGLVPKTFTPKMMKALQGYEWPGNIRQLRNAVEWMMIMSGPDRDDICLDLMPPNLRQCGGERNSNEVCYQNLDGHVSATLSEVMTKPLREAREEFERQYLLSQIERFEGNISKTARFVGMERSALHRKLKLLQVTNAQEDVIDLKQKRQAV